MLNMTQERQIIKEKNNALHFVKIINCVLQRTLLRKQKDNLQSGGNYLQNHVFNREPAN